MSKIDIEYHKLLNKILEKGFSYEDPNRKGVKRLQIPHYTFYHSFEDGFPAISTKEVYFKGAVGELLAFLSGSTDIRSLWDNHVSFWDKDWGKFQNMKKPVRNQYKSHYRRNKSLSINKYDLGKIYPYQLRNWGGQVDQFKNLIEELKTNPMKTKKTVIQWNPLENIKGEKALSECHWAFEILVRPSTREEKIVNSGIYYRFTLKWHQHSVDTFLGFCLNVIYYSLLAHIIGKMVNMIPEGVIGDLSNVHIYEPHLDAVKEQLKRDPNKYNKCELNIHNNVIIDIKKYIQNDFNNNLDLFINRLNISDFQLENYNSYPPIKADMIPYIS